MQIKKELNEIQQNIKIEYLRFINKSFKALPVLIIIGFLVLALVQSGKEYDALKASNEQIKAQSQAANEHTNKTLQNLRSEVKALRDEATKSGQTTDDRFKSLDDKIQGIKVSRAAEQAKLAVVQPYRPSSGQRSNSGGGCEQYSSLIGSYNWNLSIALAVCNAESGGNTYNENATDNHITCLGSRGLFQVGCDSTSNYGGMFDPAANVAQAYSLYSARGWQPWGATTCRIKVKCV